MKRASLFLGQFINSLPSTIRSILSIGVGDAFAKLLMFIAYVHVARVLTPDRFGEWNLAIALTALFFPLVDFGLGLIGTRQVAQSPSSFSFYYVHIVLFRMMLAVVAFVLLIFILAGGRFLPIVSSLGLLFGLSYFLMAFSATWAYQGMFRPLWFAVDKISQAGVFAVLTLAFFGGESSLLLLPVFTFISLALSSAVVFAGFVRKYLAFPVAISIRSFMRNNAAAMFALFPMSVLGQLHVTIGYVVVGLILDAEKVGEFSAAFRLFAVLLIFPNLLWSSFYPLLGRTASSTTLWTESFCIMMKYQWAAVWPFAAMALWYPGELLGLLYDGQYLGSQTLLQILFVALSISFLSMALLRTLPTLGKERQLLRIMAVATGFHIVLAVFLTLNLGMNGAGAAFLLTEVSLFAMAVFTFWPVVRRGLANGAALFFGFTVAAFVGSELIQMVVEMSRVAGLSIAVGAYALLVLKVGGFSLKQMTALESTNDVADLTYLNQPKQI